MGTTTSCPDCGKKGRKVGLITLESLLTPEAKANLGDGPMRFCRTGVCDVVYFAEAGDQRFVVADVSVPVFQKSTSPERFACHCFNHTVASLESEVRETGASEVPDSIARNCKAGLDDCERNNPQGACCLANVRLVVKTAIAAQSQGDARPAAGHKDPPAVEAHDCCAPDEVAQGEGEVDDCCSPKAQDVEEEAHDCCAPRSAVQPTPARAVPMGDGPAPSSGSAVMSAGLASSAGSVFAAILASACCWLPLALVSVGASAAGVAGFFEAYRPLFLGLTTVLLGLGFYYVYIRKPECGPGEACEVPNPRLQGLNKVTLWVATALVIVFAAFPEYVGVLVGDGSAEATPVASQGASVVRTYQIEGMTCEGCAGQLNTALGDLPGVVAAVGSYPERSATVTFADESAVDDASVLSAVAAIGYTAQPTVSE